MSILMNDNNYKPSEPIPSNRYCIYYNDVEDQLTDNVYVDFEDLSIQISRLVTDSPSFDFLSAETIRLELLSKTGVSVGTYLFETSDGHEVSLGVDWSDTSILRGYYAFEFKKYTWVPALKNLPNR